MQLLGFSIAEEVRQIADSPFIPGSWVVAGRAPEQEQEVLSMKSLNRRHFIGATTAAAVSAGIGFPNIVRAQAKETTILGLWPFTGPYADVGPLLSVGAEVALEEAGYKSGDTKLRYVTRDSETKAGSATRRAEEAIASDNAKYIEIGRAHV